MRMILLALVSLAIMAPTAEAARRDDRSREAVSRPAQVTPKPSQAQRPAQARREAAAPRRSAQPQRSAQAQRSTRPARSAQAPQRSAHQPAAPVRAGDVRTSRSGLVVRGAAAATIPREAMANCTRRNGRTVCGQRSSVAGWQSGLPTANYAQRECPEGTFATLARGHDDVVRCMPF